MNTNRSMRWLIFGILMFSLSAASFAQITVGVSVRFGPPAIPIYAQTVCPGPGYFWTPGYWAWSDYDDDYYWVPGTWVLAPIGMLWTPGYWGWDDDNGYYLWRAGYWGPHVGFYGGIDYGFGYTGVGFWGGEWRGDSFFYNRSVTNINVVNVTNVYNRTVIVNNTSRVSYNGGSGGINARPTWEEQRYVRESHRAALGDQVQHERAARQNRQLFASENHGRPAIAATGRPGEFSGRNVVAARQAGAPYHAPQISPQQARVSTAGKRILENNRSTIRAADRQQPNRDVVRNTSRQQAPQQRVDLGRQQQQARAEQRHQQQARAEQGQQQQLRAEQRQQQQLRAEQRQQQPRAEQRQQQAARQAQNRPQQVQRAAPAPRQQAQRQPQPEPKRGSREGRGPGN